MSRIFLEAELQQLESSLQIGYTQENSRLHELQQHFPAVGYRTFLDCLTDLDTRGPSWILEVGGGTNQVAAREIVSTFPHLYFIALEKRPLSPQARSSLSHASGRYRHIQNGVSSLPGVLSSMRFDAAFAHNVAEHVPDPFDLAERLGRVLKPKGIIFINKMMMYRELWHYMEMFLRSKGVEFNVSTVDPPRELRRSGVIYVSLGLRKTVDELFFPRVVHRDHINDIEGIKYSTHAISFDPDEVVSFF